MARIKYYDSVAQEWAYADMALQPPLPTGTANGDILVWDNTNQEWVVKSYFDTFYKQIEYIESTGTEYIDTGYIPNANSVIEVDGQFLDTVNALKYIGSSDTLDSTNGRCTFGTGGGSPLKWYFGVGNQNTDTGSFNANRHTFKLDIPQLLGQIDGTTIGTGTVWSSNNYLSFLLCARNAKEGIQGMCKFRVYSMTAKENGVTVRNYIAVRNIQSGVGGLYETVSGVFYANAGTGTFIKGADV